jgi:enoyl-CoA hydratase
MSTAYRTILVEQRGAVTILTLNRPLQLNALNAEVMGDIVDAAQAFDADESRRCMILTGSDRAFAAGGDINEMKDLGFAAMYASDYAGGWQQFTRTRKPVIAAVAGFALGGGCELAMACDIIIAADTARFGQPEIGLGIAPGMGGSQRLTRAIGKSKAMALCLTGRTMTADEAERANLVYRVVPAANLLDEAIGLAETIAAMPPLAAIANKEMINAAFETTLEAGLKFERRLFNGLCATDDKREGMAAFADKRPGVWTGR